MCHLLLTIKKKFTSGYTTLDHPVMSEIFPCHREEKVVTV